MEEKYEQLVELAKKVRDRAYAPYSHFPVGVALLARRGHIYTACNVENASYGLSMCAERSAVFQAIAAGDREFSAIAVVTETMAPPCGACRQVLAEFSPEVPVITADLKGNQKVHNLKDLLPAAFSPRHLQGH